MLQDALEIDDDEDTELRFIGRQVYQLLQDALEGDDDEDIELKFTGR